MAKNSRAKNLQKIEQALAKADPHLGRLIGRVVAEMGPQRPDRSYESAFQSLTRAIVSQQLSTKAAATIYGRFTVLVGGKITPQRVRAIPIRKLRSVGLSLPKARYMHNLADWFAQHGKKVDDPKLADEEIIELLTEISGIGVWTVHMFLIFFLRRPDVLPVGDLGIQKGVQMLYGLRKKAAPGFITRKAEAWRPYRSIASLYLWRGLSLGGQKKTG